MIEIDGKKREERDGGKGRLDYREPEIMYRR